MEPQRAWERELATMRAEAEVRCEANFRRYRVDDQGPVVALMQWPDLPEAIDRQFGSFRVSSCRAKSPLVAPSKFSSPPTVGDDSVTRQPRNTRVSVVEGRRRVRSDW
jgi:hypothetical protein